MQARAPLVVVEGLDRSGKTTQTASLMARLRASSIDAKLFKFPDRTTAVGQMIDSYLRSATDLDDQSVHLLFSANRWELASAISAHLTGQTAIVCDRYAFSGVAFTAAKPCAPPLAWCRAPDVGLPCPDLTIFLDVTPDIARTRGGYGQERYEHEEMQARVREVFFAIGSEGKAQGRWIVLDADKTIEEVASQIWALVEPLVTSGVPGPVGKLWQDQVV